jgi:hypothetical protein
MLQSAASSLILVTKRRQRGKVTKDPFIAIIPNYPRGEHNKRSKRFPSRVADVDED